MAEALKIVSVQRGHDPRDFALAAFGGAGPLHATALAEELGIASVVCPPIPGAFSALGLVGTDLRRDYVRTVYATAATADPSVLEAAFRAMEARGSDMLERAGVDAGRRRFDRSVDARYAGQSYELNVPVAGGAIDAAAIGGIAEAFHARHAQTYGHDNRAEPVQLVSLRLAAIGIIPPLTIRQHPAAAGTRSAKPSRQVWFRGVGTTAAQVHDRARMAAGAVVDGPAVVESLESTILIPPGWRARMDGDGFILMARTKQGAAQ
jgi:N-methylhydantoinase A